MSSNELNNWRPRAYEKLGVGQDVVEEEVVSQTSPGPEANCTTSIFTDPVIKEQTKAAQVFNNYGEEATDLGVECVNSHKGVYRDPQHDSALAEAKAEAQCQVVTTGEGSVWGGTGQQATVDIGSIATVLAPGESPFDVILAEAKAEAVEKLKSYEVVYKNQVKSDHTNSDLIIVTTHCALDKRRPLAVAPLQFAIQADYWSFEDGWVHFKRSNGLSVASHKTAYIESIDRVNKLTDEQALYLAGK